MKMLNYIPAVAFGVLIGVLGSHMNVNNHVTIREVELSEPYGLTIGEIRKTQSALNSRMNSELSELCKSHGFYGEIPIDICVQYVRTYTPSREEFQKYVEENRERYKRLDEIGINHGGVK